MHFYAINWGAVIVSAIADMLIGFLWYSPVLFAKPWMALMGVKCDTPEEKAAMQKEAGPMYGQAFVMSLISAVFLALVITRMFVPDTDLIRGLKIAFGVWFGFVMTVQYTNALFTKKPKQLFLIDTGYQLVCYLVMGAIITKWQ
jgi:hypothetical protein